MDPLVVHDMLSYLVPGLVMIILGGPFARVLARRLDRGTGVPGVGAGRSELAAIEARLERIESAIEGIALETERIGEAQRYSARLEAERAATGRLMGGGTGPS